MADTVFYVLVESSFEGMALYRLLRERGCCARIAPAPRGQTACCGISLLVEPEDIDEVRTVLDGEPDARYDRIVELDNPIDPHRDVFC